MMLVGMADTVEPRFNIPVWAGEGSFWPGVDGWNVILADIYSKAAIGKHGDASGRVAAPVADAFYWDTTTLRFYASGAGGSWTEASPIGGGTPAAARVFTDVVQAGVEGTSRIGMRADAQPALPAWPLWADKTMYGTGAELATVATGPHALIAKAYSSGQAKAGKYLIGFTLVACTTATDPTAFTKMTATLSAITAGGAPQTLDYLVPCDMDRGRKVVSYTAEYVHAGGTLEVHLSINPVTVTVDVSKGTTGVWVAYVGPTATP